MTNPSETRDSELVREVRFLLDRLNDFEPYLEDGETFRQYAGHVSPSVERLRALAADTIDRLTSSGEAVVTAEIMGTIIPYLAPAVSISEVREKLAAVLASPREGHVEVPERRDVGWLIEDTTSVNGGPQWYCEDPYRPGWHGWTNDAQAAKRFASKAEAEAFEPYRMIASNAYIKITEHVFL